MNNTHHICSRLNLTADYIGYETDAHHFLKELPHTVHDALNYLSNELESRKLLQTYTLRINELTLELGQIEERFFRDEFRNRLRGALFDVLDQLETHPESTQLLVEVINSPVEKLDLIRHLLLYGYKPWWADRHSNIDLNSLLQEALRSSPKLLVNLLKETGRNAAARTRLILRTGEKTKYSILKLIIPANYKVIRLVIKSLADYNRNINNQDPATDVNHWVWDSVLHSATRTIGVKSSSIELIETTIHDLSSETGIHEETIIQHLRSDKQLTKTKKISLILNEVNDRFASKQPASAAVSGPVSDDYFRHLFLTDNRTNNQKKRRDIIRAWSSMLTQGADAALATIRRLGREEHHRRQMAVFLREKDLQAIVRLAEPGHASFIIQQSKRTVKLRESMDGLHISKADLRAKSWEFILTYLFEDKGSRFNKKQFLRSTIRQLASAYNLKYSHLLQYFVELTESEPGGQKFRLHSILTELGHEHSRHSSTTYHRPNSAAFLETTESIMLMSFSEAKKKAQEFVLFARSTPDDLKSVIKSGNVDREGFRQIWNLLSQSEKGVVLLAISPSKISGWEQIVSRIEIISEQSKKLRNAIELNRVFDLVFEQGIIGRRDLEAILAGYITELGRVNQVPVSEVVNELKSDNNIESDQYLTNYLNAASPDADFRSIKKSRRDTQKDEVLDSGSENKIWSIMSGQVKSGESQLVEFLEKLDQNKRVMAMAYISGKSGWSGIAKTLSRSEWEQVVALTDAGQLVDEAKTIYGLFDLVAKQTLKKDRYQWQITRIRGLLTDLLIRKTSDLNGRQLMRQVLNELDEISLTELGSDQTKLISSALSSKHVPYFNQWRQHEDKSDPKDTNGKEASGWVNQTHDEAFALMLLKKLSSGSVDQRDELFFPLLHKSLADGNALLVNELFQIVRQKRSATLLTANLPPSMRKVSARILLGDGHYKNATKELSKLRPLIKYALKDDRFQEIESNSLLTYAAQRMYRAWSSRILSSVAITTTLRTVGEYDKDAVLERFEQGLVDQHNTFDSKTARTIRQILKSEDLLKVADNKPLDEVRSSSPKSAEGKIEPELPTLMEKIDIGAEMLYINRAGLVIAAPFFPRLFERLGYLRGDTFGDEYSRERAVHVMEYLAKGTTESEEHELLFQKILAGMPIEMSVSPIGSLTDEEVEISESMLNALIANWSGLGNTTIEGLRESFFLREGRLQKDDARWQLTVQAKGYDVLMDKIPWSIGMIKLPWMSGVLNVDWR